MSIRLDHAHAQQIRKEGEQAFPHECCGFLMGTGQGRERSVSRVVPVPNARDAAERRNRYTISPEDFIRGEKLARAEQLDIIGFYHTHPNAPARPSAYDTEHAWPWYSYLILSVERGQAGEMTAWVLKDDRSAFDPEPLEVE